MQEVRDSYVRIGTSIGQNFKYRFWKLELECGHTAERPCRYVNMHGKARRGFAAMWNLRPPSDLLPAPRKVKCETCDT